MVRVGLSFTHFMLRQTTFGCGEYKQEQRDQPRDERAHPLRDMSVAGRGWTMLYSG
jgi:hypothetical protein